MIAFVHGGDFGIAVERAHHPDLAGRPLVLLHSEALPLLAELSPEARAAGLFPGQAWDEAAAACPGLARIVGRPALYSAESTRLLQALAAISPELEPFAPGEAFLDLTGCQSYYRHDPHRIATLLQDAVAAAGGPPCAVGIAGDKTTARWAARQAGPGGVAVVAPAEAAARLAPLSLAELCGAGPGVTEFLAGLGVHRCGDMARIPVGVPASRFGNHGRRLWLMAQGMDPAPVRPRTTEPGAGVLPGLGRLLPPACADAGQLLAALQQLATRLQLRLQRDGLAVRHFRVGLRAPEGWRQEGVQLADPADWPGHFRRLLRRHWFGEVIRQVHLQALADPADVQQDDIFSGGRRSGGRRSGGRRSGGRRSGATDPGDLSSPARQNA